MDSNVLITIFIFNYRNSFYINLLTVFTKTEFHLVLPFVFVVKNFGRYHLISTVKAFVCQVQTARKLIDIMQGNAVKGGNAWNMVSSTQTENRQCGVEELGPVESATRYLFYYEDTITPPLKWQKGVHIVEKKSKILRSISVGYENR